MKRIVLVFAAILVALCFATAGTNPALAQAKKGKIEKFGEDKRGIAWKDK